MKVVAASAPFPDGLDDQRLRNVESNGVRIRYYEDGAGEPLILLSGGEYGALYSLDAWSLNLKKLAQHFHVYAFDKPGQGYSDPPKQDADYTFEWLYDSIHGVLRVLGVRQAHLVGHSRGALVAAQMALRHPEMVKTIIIVDSSTLAPEDPHVPTDLFYAEIGARTPLGPPTLETVRIEVDAQSFSKAHITDDYIGRMLKIASLPTMQKARQRMRELRLDVWYPSLYRCRAETLAQIEDHGLTVPALIIWGFNDRAAPLYLGHRLFERMCPRTPHAEFHVLNQAGHYSFREQWQKFNRVVEDFCLR